MKIILAVVLALSGCFDLIGNGNVEADTRSLSGFTSVQADTSLYVVVTEDPTTSVVVQVDSNLARYITTSVVGTTLVIGQTRDLEAAPTSVVMVHVPTLVSVDHQGSGGMTVTVHNNALDATLGGSGSMDVSGSTGALTVGLSGSGSLDATGLAATGAKASLAGSGSGKLVVDGDATLDVSGSGSFQAELDDGRAWFTVSGSGSIDWSGTSQMAAENVTGSGNVTHR